MNIPSLGAARFPSPLKRRVNESERVPATILRTAELYSCENPVKSGGLIHEHPRPRCSALAVTSQALG